MATGSIDLVDIPFIGIFAFAAAAGLGLFVLPLPFIDLNMTLFEIGQGQGRLIVTLATILSIVSLGFTFYTNQLDFSRMTGVEYWIVIATIGLVLAAPFNVILETLLPNTTAAFIAWTIQSAGVTSLSYTG